MKQGFSKLVREGRPAILLSILIGVAAYALTLLISLPYADPLLLALILGISTRTFIGDKWHLNHSSTVATILFIPMGIIFYSMQNLNFATLSSVRPAMFVLLFLVLVVYFGVIMLLGRLLGQRKQIIYLTASGSAICGASAIAIVSSAVEAEADDISVSLIAVALAGFVGLFTILPFLATLFDISSRTYGLLSGSVLQFTGFVKAAVDSVPYLSVDIPHRDLVKLALSVKALRYFGLLVAIPLFASLVKKKIHIPAALWLFFGAGLFGTWISVRFPSLYSTGFARIISLAYNFSWSIAMAAIGLNADIKQLLGNNGITAILMAFAGFFAATVTFFVGLFIVNLMIG